MSLKTETSTGGDIAKLAFRFVLLIGIVNFFADMTYEGGRGIIGPFLGSLGASAAIIEPEYPSASQGTSCMRNDRFDRWPADCSSCSFGHDQCSRHRPIASQCQSWYGEHVYAISDERHQPISVRFVSEVSRERSQTVTDQLAKSGDKPDCPLITAFVLYQRGGYHHAFAYGPYTASR